MTRRAGRAGWPVDEHVGIPAHALSPFSNAPGVRRSRLALAAVVIVPIAYVVIGGFRTNGQLAAKPVGLPHPWVSHNYTKVVASGDFWRMVGNSIIIAAIATVLVVGVSALAAYPLARLQFRGREAIYTFFTFGLLFPIAVAALPLYLLLRQLHLDETLLGVALPEAAFGIPITVIILRPFMRAVPAELEDAAAMDGCTSFGFFWRILLPLTRPALMTVTILSVITSWNNFILPLLVRRRSAPLDASARRGELLDRPQHGRRRRAGLHDPVDHPGARLLPLRRAPHRRRALGRRQGLARARSPVRDRSTPSGIRTRATGVKAGVLGH